EEPIVLVGPARSHGLALILLVLFMLAGLPVAAWLDLHNLTETPLLRQAQDQNSVSAAGAAITPATSSAVCSLRRARHRSCITRAFRAPYRSPQRSRSSSDGSSASSSRTSPTAYFRFPVQKPCAARA